MILIGSIIAYSVTYLQKYCKYNFRFHDQLLHGPWHCGACKSHSWWGFILVGPQQIGDRVSSGELCHRKTKRCDQDSTGNLLQSRDSKFSCVICVSHKPLGLCFQSALWLMSSSSVILNSLWRGSLLLPISPLHCLLEEESIFLCCCASAAFRTIEPQFMLVHESNKLKKPVIWSLIAFSVPSFFISLS